MTKQLAISLIVATGLMGSSASGQTLIAESVNQDPEINSRQDGEIGRNIGRAFPGTVDQSTEFRQRYYGDVEATLQPNSARIDVMDMNAVGMANAVEIDVQGSALAKGKQRLRGSVTAVVAPEFEQAKPSIEVKLNAAAFGNSLRLINTGTQIVDLRQRNDGDLVQAEIHADLTGVDASSVQSNAIALSNNFSSQGPASNFGGDINQRNDADVVAYNRTSGVRSNDTVQAVAVGNSISVTRK